MDFKYTLIDNDNVAITKATKQLEGEITIPASIDGYPVVEIGDRALECQNKITSVKIPITVKIIGKSAFYYCTSLTKLDIPSSVIMIKDRAFQDCAGLISLALPDSVQHIGQRAFQGCHNLTGRITVPISVLTEN